MPEDPSSLEDGLTLDDDDAVPDDNEDNPFPTQPIYPPPPPPPGFPPPDDGGDGTSSGSDTGIAAFSVELREPVSADTVLQNVSAEYVGAKPLQLPLTQQIGEFVFAVEADPEQPDGKHYTVFVAGKKNVLTGNFILLLLKLAPREVGKKGQAGASLGKLQ